MYKEKKIGVVVPAYNEEKLIIRVMENMPDFVDRIIIVDDCSKDNTVQVVEDWMGGETSPPTDHSGRSRGRVLLLRHKENRGVGAAISTGYLWCRDHDLDIAVVMAGDGQMDPEDLPNLLDPIVDGKVDYAKGNRLVTGEAWKKIPRVRYLGNAALTFLTKIASGYWHVTDSQTGYTALNKKALHLIPLENIYPRYGMPNDLLVTLNIYNMRVGDVPVTPVYGIGEESGFSASKMLFPMFRLIVRLFFRRMFQKYIIRDFHPLILFYLFGFILILFDVPLVFRFFIRWYNQGTVPEITALALLFCTTLGLQSLFFAMLADMEHNSSLKGY